MTAAPKKVYIDLSPLAARPSLFKMAMSDRGDGKTSWMTCHAVETHDATGKTALFCRRFSTEFNADFFDTFIPRAAAKNPALFEGRDYDFIKPTKKHTGALMLADRETGEKRKAITFVPVSMAGRLKSSFEYTINRNIYYDEFIPLDGRYLPNECTAMLELYRTVDRDHYENAFFIACNKITPFNPFFNYFNITPKTGLNSYRNGTLDVFIWRNAGNADNAQKSPFGALTAGTPYEAYNGGEYLVTAGDLIHAEHTRAVFVQVIDGGRLFSAYVAEVGIVFDETSERRQDVPLLCWAPQPPTAGAMFLQDPRADRLRRTLKNEKYGNRLYFANDRTASLLSRFYALI